METERMNNLVKPLNCKSLPFFCKYCFAGRGEIWLKQNKWYRNFILPVLLMTAFSCAVSQTDAPKTPTSSKETPRNIILLIGDGMGLSQISYHILSHRTPSVFEQFTHFGFQKTHAANNLITDSAAGATAMASGRKTKTGMIGISPEGDTLPSIMDYARMRGLGIGLITTTTLVHATPAGFYAHVPRREMYEAIASQLPGKPFDLLIGGGKKYFDRRTTDDQNLLDIFRANGYQIGDYFNDRLNARAVNINRPFLFFTADDQPVTAEYGREYLPYATELGANFLDNKSDNGFFLLIEGGQIDWAGHYKKPGMLRYEMQDFEEAVQEALDFAKMDGTTLIIVTADHETGGLALHQDANNPKKIQAAYTTNGHTATLVPVMAYGPGAEKFRGIYDNTELFKKMMQSLGFSENKDPLSITP